MEASTLVGDWAVCVGNLHTPVRKIGLTDVFSVRSLHGAEASWKLLGSDLLLIDKNQTILSIFDTSTLATGVLRGRVSQLGFCDSPIWLVRGTRAGVRMPDTPLPIHAGPLPASVTTPEGFLDAYRGTQDFSVVLHDGNLAVARPPLPESLNFGTSPDAEKFELCLSRASSTGYPATPAFFTVLHDCWIVDGMIAVTRDGHVLHETTQFPGLEPLWDTDYHLLGSKITALEQLVSVTSHRPTTTIEMPVFLFSTLKLGYGHWLGQSVTNWVFLDWIREAAPDIANQLALGINGGVTNEDFRLISLQLLGVDNPVLPIPKGIVHCKKLIVPSFHRSHSHHWPGMGKPFRVMGENALRMLKDPPKPGRIYASRRGQLRSFSEDAKIEAVLQKHGFSSLIGGTIPFVEQVATYAMAEAVFGIYGSNMCNISFCPKDSVTIEVFDEMHHDPFWEYYLANASDLRYCYIITAVSSELKDRGFQERTTDLPPDVLDELLSKIL